MEVYKILMRSSNVANKKSNFEPSMKILPRVMKVILEHSSIRRTMLTVTAKVNYNTLSKHLKWLEGKGFVELILDDGKVIVKLTPSGREFALKLANLYMFN